MEITAGELAKILNGEVEGDETLVLDNLATIQTAAGRDVTFLSNKRYNKYLESTSAAALIIAIGTVVDRKDLTLIRVKDPYLGFLQTLKLFHSSVERRDPGIHESSIISASAEIDSSAFVGARAVIGDKVSIGKGSVIGEGCVLTESVSIGDDCLIHPNVTILAHATIGSNVIIHSGTTIGSDGFGFVPMEGAWEKIPQIGTVIVEDDVEIGANCAIDRATIGHTHIGRGVKIDNLIQIAHNVEIGEHSVIAAQSGISGSTRLGKHVIIAGQVGLVGHIDIGDNVTVTAQSGVSKSISGEGKVYRGSPASEMREELRQEAAIRQLPDIITKLRRIEKKLKDKDEDG